MMKPKPKYFLFYDGQVLASEHKIFLTSDTITFRMPLKKADDLQISYHSHTKTNIDLFFLDSTLLQIPVYISKMTGLEEYGETMIEFTLKVAGKINLECGFHA